MNGPRDFEAAWIELAAIAWILSAGWILFLVARALAGWIA